MLAARRKGIAAMLGAHFYRTIILAMVFASVSLTTSAEHASQQDQQAPPTSAMPGMEAGGTQRGCDDLSSMGGMSVMGESMGAMTNHMCITPIRARQPGDEEKVKAMVAQVRAAIEKYKDYKKALADGYVIANPKVVQPQYHFTNDANVRLADTMFDPTKPSSLLYYHTPTQRYQLEGVMYTARPSSTEDELNQRIPLSIVRWHEHTNFCGAPADKVKEYFGDHPKFGMFGSIHTKDACQAEGGTFMPVIFTWMIHMFPYEDNLKDVFSMNDDLPHVH
jgi:cytochrome c556